MHHTLTHLLDSITKHFDPWVNRHLPLAIFTEQPLARAVTSFFANEQYQGPAYYNSPIQGTAIDVRRFCLFLNKRCTTKDALLSSDRIKNNMQEIRLIQQGFNLWDDGVLPMILEDYRDNYILHDASFPTNTHMAERAVKSANHCSLLNRQEASRTLCAVANFESVRKCNKRSRDMYEQTHNRKSTPTDQEIIRTKVKGEALISDCLDEVDESTDINQQRITKRVLTAKEHQFSSKTDATFVSLYEAHHNVPRNSSHHLETRQGVTRTALIDNRVLFKKMLKNPYRPFIIAELEARGIHPTAEELGNYNKLLTRLKVSEGNKQSFAPVMPYVNFQWW